MVSRRANGEPTARHAGQEVDLSLDSLIEVFMNVLGVLMIRHGGCALSQGPGPIHREGRTLPSEETAKPETSTTFALGQARADSAATGPSCSNRSPSRFMCCDPRGVTASPTAATFRTAALFRLERGILHLANGAPPGPR